MAADWVVELKQRAQAGGSDFVIHRDGGSITVTVAMDPFDAGERTAFEVVFRWEEQSSYSPFTFDICPYEDLSPASSSPSDGWVSWMYPPRLALAHQSWDLEQSDAKVLEEDGLSIEDVSDPTDEEWAQIARAITRELMS